ncbi:MAG: DUF433 domain-containing protein [Bacteroidota bacterium]|jgi:uncharacterized protein (DUF433 family)
MGIETLLVRTPNVCGGRLRIQGTRITVLQIASVYKQGWGAEEIVVQYPHLSLAEVYAALAYYHANRDEVERELREEQLDAERLEQEFKQTSHAV